MKKKRSFVMNTGSDAIGIDSREWTVDSMYQVQAPTKWEKIQGLSRLKRKERKDKTVKVAYGASHQDFYTSNVGHLYELHDPYFIDIRRIFNDCALTDPTIKTAIERRKDSAWADGYHLELELVSEYSEIDGHYMEDFEKQAVLMELEKKNGYNRILKTLNDWSHTPEIDMENLMREHLYLNLVQGRALSMIHPGFKDLSNNKLPGKIYTISAEETGTIILDKRNMTIFAVRFYTTLIGAGGLLPGEMIYSYRNNMRLRRNEDFYGRSILEPLVQLSRANKKIINFDYPKAVRAAYFQKILLQRPVDGTDDEKRAILKETQEMIASQDGEVIVAEQVPGTETSFQIIPTSVDHQMVEAIRKDYNQIIIPAMGSTASKMGQTEDLSRDNATIQEVQEVREVRTPDEKLIGKFFENQLLNPLMAHLLNKPVATLDVRIKIVRNPPEDETIGSHFEKEDERNGGRQDAMNDPRMAQKGQEMRTQKVQQKGGGAYGASDNSVPWEIMSRYNDGHITKAQALKFLKGLKS